MFDKKMVGILTIQDGMIDVIKEDCNLKTLECFTFDQNNYNITPMGELRFKRKTDL